MRGAHIKSINVSFEVSLVCCALTYPVGVLCPYFCILPVTSHQQVKGTASLSVRLPVVNRSLRRLHLEVQRVETPLLLQGSIHHMEP